MTSPLADNTKPIADENIWAADGPFSEITLYRDWDYFAGQVESLRMHLFEYQTIPQWNFFFCGGVPELANPQSWAFTPLSVIAYLLPGNWAIVAIWMLFSALGAWAMKKLLGLFDVRGVAAWAGASVYVLSGYFAAHFNQGHVTFALMHLVPLMTYLWCNMLMGRDGGGTWRTGLALMLSTWVFFTSALPHPLFFAYPAMILVVIGVVSWRVVESKDWREQLVTSGMFHALGIALSLYKLIPMAFWQMRFPREGVAFESHGLLGLLEGLISPHADYGDMSSGLDYLPTQHWSSWEHNNFVGLIPLLALVFVGAKLRYFKRLPRPMAVVAVMGAALVGIGFWLNLGNGNPFSPSYLFQYLPVLEGVRVFGRYFYLANFGLAILTAVFVILVAEQAASRARTVVAVVIALTVVPLVFQWATLVHKIRGVPDAALVNELRDAPDQRNLYLEPWAVHPKAGYSFHRATLAKGTAVLKCYEPLAVNRPVLTAWGHVPMLVPEAEVQGFALQSAGIRFEGVGGDRYIWHGATPPDVSSNFTHEHDGKMLLFTRPAEVDDGYLELRVEFPERPWSLAGTFAAFAVAVWFTRRVAKRENSGLRQTD